jgi:ABC-type transport system substrate-binding protein
VKLLEQMQAILMKDLPLVPVVERPSQLVVRKGISCWFGKTDNTTEFQYLRDDGKPCTAPVSK